MALSGRTRREPRPARRAGHARRDPLFRLGQPGAGTDARLDARRRSRVFVRGERAMKARTLGAMLAALLLAACSGAGGGSSGTTTLTLWARDSEKTFIG